MESGYDVHDMEYMVWSTWYGVWGMESEYEVHGMEYMIWSIEYGV